MIGPFRGQHRKFRHLLFKFARGFFFLRLDLFLCGLHYDAGAPAGPFDKKVGLFYGGLKIHKVFGLHPFSVCSWPSSKAPRRG